MEGKDGKAGRYEDGYCLIGLPNADHIDHLKAAIEEVRIPVGTDNDYLIYRDYTEGEAPQTGWRHLVARINTRIYQNATLFPGGIVDLLKQSLEIIPGITEDDWRYVDLREDLTPPLVKITGNTVFQDAITKFPKKNHPRLRRQARVPLGR